eukprot:TRINITY_DN5309_c0_g1_i1.p1 TRINITY_DN5309_c0_g1~~TRINITY_DN5309_c0_g1_i1.p1  ORF type:complete len:968 (-),score=200.79 TRINITY_DN5309_c0_g1_i1:40-2943(-)
MTNPASQFVSLRQFDRIKVIGQGSFGSAVLVKHKLLNQFFVIKEINVAEMSEKERGDAANEVSVLQLLKHPNIIAYHGSFTEKGLLCIVMDYAEGGDLHEQIKQAKKKFFSENTILDWFIQVAMALQHIHAKNVLHRDLKTQNIFLKKNGLVKLGDFGISRVLNSETEMARTVIGTPYYLSPELCEDQPYNKKSDIWALGCVLYEITTLRHAFDGQNLPALVLKILRGVYPPIPDSYSQGLRELIDWMLQKRPEDRPDIDAVLSFPCVKDRIRLWISNGDRVLKHQPDDDVVAKQHQHLEQLRAQQAILDSSALNLSSDDDSDMSDSDLAPPPPSSVPNAKPSGYVPMLPPMSPAAAVASPITPRRIRQRPLADNKLSELQDKYAELEGLMQQAPHRVDPAQKLREQEEYSRRKREFKKQAEEVEQLPAPIISDKPPMMVSVLGLQPAAPRTPTQTPAAPAAPAIKPKVLAPGLDDFNKVDSSWVQKNSALVRQREEKKRRELEQANRIQDEINAKKRAEAQRKAQEDLRRQAIVDGRRAEKQKQERYLAEKAMEREEKQRQLKEHEAQFKQGLKAVKSKIDRKVLRGIGSPDEAVQSPLIGDNASSPQPGVIVTSTIRTRSRSDTDMTTPPTAAAPVVSKLTHTPVAGDLTPSSVASSVASPAAPGARRPKQDRSIMKAIRELRKNAPKKSALEFELVLNPIQARLLEQSQETQDSVDVVSTQAVAASKFAKDFADVDNAEMAQAQALWAQKDGLDFYDVMDRMNNILKVADAVPSMQPSPIARPIPPKPTNMPPPPPVHRQSSSAAISSSESVLSATTRRSSIQPLNATQVRIPNASLDSTSLHMSKRNSADMIVISSSQQPLQRKDSASQLPHTPVRTVSLFQPAPMSPEDNERLSIRIEALRQQCGMSLGDDLFLMVYNRLRQATESDELQALDELRLKLGHQAGILRTIQQLIYCEDRFYGS